MRKRDAAKVPRPPFPWAISVPCIRNSGRWPLRLCCCPNGTMEISPRFQPGECNQPQPAKSRRDDVGLHRSSNVFCFKYIFWIVVDIVTFQDGQELVLEILLLMVLLLLLYILPDSWNLGLTHRKCTIASLPFESHLRFLLIVDPFGRTSFDVL